MAGYSARSDQLWQFAAQLFEEEAKSIQFAQQEEHGKRIKIKFNQIVSNLSCLGDIIATMFEKEKLTQKEFEQIRHLQPTPIRANEELLSIIARKPRDVFECFLSLIKRTNQLHLYQMLVSSDDTCDKVKGEDASKHKDLIRRNFIWLSEKLDTENGLISLLYKQNVLTVREKEPFFCMNNTFQKSELLLGLLSKKSSEDFEKFLEALEASGQGHLATKLRKPEDSLDDLATVPSADSVPKIISHTLLPEEIRKSRQKPVPVRPLSEPFLPSKMLPKSGQKLIPSRSLSKPDPPPKPDIQSTSVQHYAKSMQVVAKPTEKSVNFQRTEGDKFQARLKGLESRLRTDFAIKVTYVSMFSLDKPGDCLKMYLRIVLEECDQMRKEIVARDDETNQELEQLRERYSAASALNEVFRAQLHSLQQELTSERLQNKKERMQLEDNLKTNIYNEKVKCNRFEEEKLVNKTVIREMKESLNRADNDKQVFKQQLNKLNALLASTECELRNCKTNLEECSIETISLRNEREKLNEECEILKKENEMKKDLKVLLFQTQQDNQNLITQLNEKGRSLELAEEEMLNLIKLQKDTVEQKSMQSVQILKLQEELESEKLRRLELEDKHRKATAQLVQLNRKLKGRNITSVTEEFPSLFFLMYYTDSHSIRRNHQFLVENIKSSRLIDLLHEKNCISDDERVHLNKQPLSFYRNDALLQWLRTIPFEEDKGQMVLECFRHTEQNFVADLLERGGVLIKSKISTELVKGGRFDKSASNNAEVLKEKEAMVIERLNQRQGLSLSNSQNATSENADDDIVIAPYCHQEANGIIVWFWCQSNYGQRNLQIMYESNILLGRLTTIFKQFSSDGSASTAPESLVLTSISIFVGDFENEIPEK